MDFLPVCYSILLFMPNRIAAVSGCMSVNSENTLLLDFLDIFGLNVVYEGFPI